MGSPLLRETCNILPRIGWHHGPRELVHAWVEAFTNARSKKIASFYSEGATTTKCLVACCDETVVRTMFANAFALAEMSCIPEHSFEDGEWPYSNGADPVRHAWMRVLHIGTEKIVFQRGYLDKLTFLS